jgi:hypothetical protein
MEQPLIRTLRDVHSRTTPNHESIKSGVGNEKDLIYIYIETRDARSFLKWYGPRSEWSTWGMGFHGLVHTLEPEQEPELCNSVSAIDPLHSLLSGRICKEVNAIMSVLLFNINIIRSGLSSRMRTSCVMEQILRRYDKNSITVPLGATNAIPFGPPFCMVSSWYTA